VAVSFLALSCTEDRQNPTEPSSTAATAKSCPSTDPIQAQICALFPATDLLKSATDFYNNVKTKKQQNRLAEAQARAFELIDFTLKNLKAGKLLDPNGSSAPTREAAVAKLTCDILVYVSLTCGGLSADALGSNGTAQVVGPEGGVVLTPDKHSGVSIPKGAMPSAGLITVAPIDAHAFPARGGPLPTDLDQYLLFRHYTLSASFDHFDKPVTVGICHLDVGDGDYAPPTQAVEDRLQLAHPDPNNPAVIELLVRVAAPFLFCGDFNTSSTEVPPSVVIGLKLLTPAGMASVGRSLTRKLTPLIETLLPTRAEAAMMGSCCLGGTTTKFSPFGAVDPESGGELGLLFQPNNHSSDRNHFVGASIRPCTNPPLEPGDGCHHLYVKMESVDGSPSGIGRTVTASLLVLNAPTGTTPVLGGDNTQLLESVTLGEDEFAAATFTDLEIDQPGHYQLKFEAPGAAPVTSDPFDVYKLEFTLQPTPEPNGVVTEGAFLGQSDPDFENLVVRVSTLDYQGNVVTGAADPIIMFLVSNPLLELHGTYVVNSIDGVANFTQIGELQTGLTVDVLSGCTNQLGKLLTFTGPAGGVSDQIESQYFLVAPVCIG
jgi:hypothetical protein